MSLSFIILNTFKYQIKVYFEKSWELCSTIDSIFFLTKKLFYTFIYHGHCKYKKNLQSLWVVELKVILYALQYYKKSLTLGINYYFFFILHGKVCLFQLFCLQIFDRNLRI